MRFVVCLFYQFKFKHNKHIWMINLFIETNSILLLIQLLTLFISFLLNKIKPYCLNFKAWLDTIIWYKKLFISRLDSVDIIMCLIYATKNRDIQHYFTTFFKIWCKLQRESYKYWRYGELCIMYNVIWFLIYS